LHQTVEEEEDKMNARGWFTILIVYTFIASLLVLLMYFVGHILLQLPIRFVLILAALGLLAFTIGVAGPFLVIYRRQRRQ